MQFFFLFHLAVKEGICQVRYLCINYSVNSTLLAKLNDFYCKYIQLCSNIEIENPLTQQTVWTSLSKSKEA
jgi:hypothetical protein